VHEENRRSGTTLPVGEIDAVDLQRARLGYSTCCQMRLESGSASVRGVWRPIIEVA
jgi:hypothetical protein